MIPVGPGALARHLIGQLAARAGMVDLGECACRGVKLGCEHADLAAKPASASDLVTSGPRPPAVLARPGRPSGVVLAVDGDRAFWKGDAGCSGWVPIDDLVMEPAA